MRKICFTWHLIQEDSKIKIARYCPQCRKIVPFTDSFKRRRNNNGKNVHEFAIYKCEKDHTWNRKHATYKADQVSNRKMDKSTIVPRDPLTPIDLLQLKENR